MFTFIGIISVIIGISLLIIKPFLTFNDEYQVKTDRLGNQIKVPVKKKSHPILLSLTKNKRISIFFSILGIFFMILPYLFFYSERGYNYLLVFPSGKMDAVMTQGIKFRGFAKIDPWLKYIDVKVVNETNQKETDVNELEGVMRPVPIRFIDQVTADGYVSLRFQLPEIKELFIDLAVKYRTMSNLVYNTIIPTAREQLINTGYMFAAQDYISGDAQSFRQTFEEQLKNGTYAVNKIEKIDTIYADIEMKNNSRRIKEIKTRYEVKRIEIDGIVKRIPHELSENNIIVSQVIVDDIDLESAFKTRLEKQRDESAKRQLEQQMIETAKAEQQRIIAQGERDKSQERVNQEKEQVSKLIAIETKLKQESTERDLARIALETAKLQAQAQKVKADADSYQNRQLVNAGLTPQERAKIDKETAIGVAAELAKMKFPTYMVIGGEDGKSNPIESLIGSAMAKQLLEPTKK